MYLLMAGLPKYQRAKLRDHQGFYSSPLSYKYSLLLKPLSSFSFFDYSRLRGAVQKTLQILCGAGKQFRGIPSQGPGNSSPAMFSGARGPKPLIAVCQVTSTPDRERNWVACSQLVREATRRDACVVFLPEAFDFIGSCTEETLSLAEPLEGDYLQRYVSLARECGVWLSLGGFHEKGKDWESTRRIYNCHLLVDATGNEMSLN
ncbi:deaminated glutathione amidase isoform X1 [Notechis scutatus]|uniref:Deaminated glutathione amidase isoform X1 n=1 Tax=Notechis scutatus TaxID=8663 RepID=A0A6J1VRT2_9SAUR|nr:deaminated glutathione amidase isoform X1 [Notechis scutatus]